jgi:hypothetical protein
MNSFYKKSFGYKSEMVTTGRDCHNIMGYGSQASYATIKITLPGGDEIVETACFNPDCKPFWIPSQNHRHLGDLVSIIKDIWGSEEIGRYYHDIVSGTIQNKILEF